MKVDVATTRDDAALELGMFLGTPYARELFDLNGYDSSTRIVPVSEDEPFDRVVNEHMRQGGRTLVAVFFPGRKGPDRFEFLQWATRNVAVGVGGGWGSSSCNPWKWDGGGSVLHRVSQGFGKKVTVAETSWASAGLTATHTGWWLDPQLGSQHARCR